MTLGEAAAAGSTVTAPLAQGTAPHVVLGTPGYMAPEQVRGEPVDHRADIFAFGCVLYELLGGRPAFRGATTLEVLGAILRDTPVPIPSVPSALSRIIERSLEKEPAARFQSARDLAFALGGLTAGPRVLRPRAAAAVLVAVVLVGLVAGWWGMTRGAPPSPRLDSIAVLPFANRTGDPGQQQAGAYEAKGMYEEAVIAWEQAVALMGDGDVRRRAFLARAYGLAGRRDEALRILSELLTLQESSYVPPTAIAVVYVGLGQLDEAMAWLERGYDGRDGDIVLLNTWPVLDPLRSDPRFQRLLRRMDFPP